MRYGKTQEGRNEDSEEWEDAGGLFATLGYGEGDVEQTGGDLLATHAMVMSGLAAAKGMSGCLVLQHPRVGADVDVHGSCCCQVSC